MANCVESNLASKNIELFIRYISNKIYFFKLIKMSSLPADLSMSQEMTH